MFRQNVELFLPLVEWKLNKCVLFLSWVCRVGLIEVYMPCCSCTSCRVWSQAVCSDNMALWFGQSRAEWKGKVRSGWGCFEVKLALNTSRLVAAPHANEVLLCTRVCIWNQASVLYSSTVGLISVLLHLFAHSCGPLTQYLDALGIICGDFKGTIQPQNPKHVSSYLFWCELSVLKISAVEISAFSLI